jgi:LuxR family transcriptional regulator, maltose regulon positive regulatory protein
MSADPPPAENLSELDESPLLEGALTRGRTALAASQWLAARAAFEELLGVRESPEALEGLGAASWWLADVAVTFAARERAFRLFRNQNDLLGAARLATAIANDYFILRGDYAMARAWRQRAHRLLEGHHDCSEHGWLAVAEAHMALEADHAPFSAQTWSAQAVGLGRTLGDVNLEMLAMAYEGLALAHQGHIQDGLARLEDAAMAAVGGDLTDVHAACTICHCLIQACERTRDLEQAARWCSHLEQMAARWDHQLAAAQAHSHYARLLVWQGEWALAEVEQRAATEALKGGYAALAGEGLVRLATLLARQGRFSEAEALIAQCESAPYKLLADDLCVLARARLAFERDDPETAANLAERYLRALPAEDRLRRVAGLELQIKALVVRNEVSRASRALVDLSAITAGLASRPMQASARFAAGLVFAAQNNRDSAKACFEEAVELWTRSGTPYEAARARLQLARALAALGRHLEATEEARSGLTVLRSVGATREVERATALLRKLEGPPSVRDGGGGPSLTKRELQVLRLIARGLSNKEIAQQLIVSEHTVHRHIANIFEKLHLPSRAAAAAYAAQNYLL